MIICGIKLTHDGAIALIDGDRLILSYEIEKLNNNYRHSVFSIDMPAVNTILGDYADRLDKIVLDGWYNNDDERPDELVMISLGDERIPVELAKYGNFSPGQDILEPMDFSSPPRYKLDYRSYTHVGGHIASAYCTSPFAERGEDSYVLVWDGGMFPQLFYYHHASNRVDSIGLLFLILGNIYRIFPQQFEPYRKTLGNPEEAESVPGKAMAYIALGKYRKELIPIFESVYYSTENNLSFTRVFSERVAEKLREYDYSSADILYTFHVYMEKTLVDGLVDMIVKKGQQSRNLCFVGGCALNIKWNSAIRNCGLFDEVWVPPFPNDAGSAIGTACCEMIRSTGNNRLKWNVYSGPPVIQDFSDPGWTSRSADVKELALFLFEKNEPVVFLNGLAELGPRALGNRSILAQSTHPAMKRVLNKIKGREGYRPVAPICLEEDAPLVFTPGIKDPYMLFDHLVKPEWVDRIPAVCHLDGTARLQTVSATGNPTIHELLQEYKKLSGIPLLCNTSANHKGRGFFPDISSAIGWNQVNYIWGDGVLYERKEKIRFAELDQLVDESKIIFEY